MEKIGIYYNKTYVKFDNTIALTPESWKLYQENSRVNDLIIRTGKALEESNDVNEVELKQRSTNESVARFERTALTKIKVENGSQILISSMISYHESAL